MHENNTSPNLPKMDLQITKQNMVQKFNQLLYQRNSNDECAYASMEMKP